MNSFLELASTRRSIRKFTDKEIPAADIEYFIKAAVSAPSGCNSQCWKFVAIRDKDIIMQIGEAVTKKVEEVLEDQKDDLSKGYLASKKIMVSFFTKAPVVIAVFMTGVEYYDPQFTSALMAKGYTDKDIMELYGNYDFLSVGAAVQNLLLAVHEKGYGACWMNDPAIAGKEINKILKVPEEHRFISLVPVGEPAYTPRDKKMKEFSEVFSLL